MKRLLRAFRLGRIFQFGLWINLPFFELQTHLFREVVEEALTEAVLFNVKVFKWSFNFRMYRPWLWKQGDLMSAERETTDEELMYKYSIHTNDKIKLKEIKWKLKKKAILNTCLSVIMSAGFIVLFISAGIHVITSLMKTIPFIIKVLESVSGGLSG